jgi:type III pantothenate kinase
MKVPMRADSTILAIDVGNRAIKMGQFGWPLRDAKAAAETESRRVIRLSSAAPDWNALQAWLPREPAAAFLVSVCPPAADRLMAWLARTCPECQLHRLQWSDFPLRVTVDSPERVGQDRLAAAVAAKNLKSAERAAIVVDAGSAITVDLVSPAGDFLGGAILPGWQTMARSLATTTHLLPHVDTGAFPANPEVVGRSTETAIASGLFWGSVGAVRELVERMAQPWDPPPERLLGGGDMQTLLPHLGPSFRCVPDMVLWGVVQTAVVLAGLSSSGKSAER